MSSSSTQAELATIPKPFRPYRKRQGSLIPIVDARTLKRARQPSFSLSYEIISSGWTAFSSFPTAHASENSRRASAISIPDSTLSRSSSSTAQSRSPSPDAEAAESSFLDTTLEPIDDASLPATPLATPPPAEENIWIIGGLDIKMVMTKGTITKFSAKQDSQILLWMKVNGTRSITGHKEAFAKLLVDLGFAGKGHEKAVEDALRTKVSARIISLYNACKRKNIVEDVESGYKNIHGYKVRFVDWTDRWLKANWDGNVDAPVCWPEYTDKDLEDGIPVAAASENTFTPVYDDGPEIFVVESPVLAPKKLAPVTNLAPVAKPRKKKGVKHAIADEPPVVVEQHPYVTIVEEGYALHNQARIVSEVPPSMADAADVAAVKATTTAPLRGEEDFADAESNADSSTESRHESTSPESIPTKSEKKRKPSYRLSLHGGEGGDWMRTEDKF